jgi:hypothetical protein
MPTGSSTSVRLACWAAAALALPLIGPDPPLLGSATAAECAGDECQGPPPAPEEIVPGTAIVEGPGNPPVRFPHHRGKKHKHSHKHHHKRSPHHRRGAR